MDMNNDWDLPNIASLQDLAEIAQMSKLGEIWQDRLMTPPPPSKPVDDWNLIDICGHYSETPTDSDMITEMREKIINRWMYLTEKDRNFTTLTKHDMTILFELLDDEFFGSRIQDFLTKYNWTIQIVPNRRLTSVAGKCRRSSSKCSVTIELATKIFLDTFTTGETCHRANGIRCCSRIECVLLVLEHEVVHALAGLFCRPKSPHGPVFKSLARNIFGHTHFQHSLTHGDAVELDNREKRRIRIRQKIKKIMEQDGSVKVLFEERPGKLIEVNVTSTGSHNYVKATGEKKNWSIPYDSKRIHDIY